MTLILFNSIYIFEIFYLSVSYFLLFQNIIGNINFFSRSSFPLSLLTAFNISDISDLLKKKRFLYQHTSVDILRGQDIFL